MKCIVVTFRLLILITTSSVIISSCSTAFENYEEDLFHKNSVPQTFTEKYSKLDNENIDVFIDDWEEWSGRVAASLEYNRFDEVVGRCLDYFEITKSPHNYLTLPANIPVSVQKKDIDYTPHVKCNKPVLYVTPEIDSLIFPYLGGVNPEDYLGTSDGYVHVNPDNIEHLKNIIPFEYGHWSGYWYLETMPIINRIKITKKSVDFDLRLFFNYCAFLHVPHNVNEDIIYEDGYIE